MRLDELMDNLMEHERSMAAMYRLLAGRFPARAHGLETLAREEGRHAVMLRNAHARLGRIGLLTAADVDVSLEQLTRLHARIDRLAAAARAGVPDWADTLDELLLLEGSVGEVAIYEVITRHRDQPDCGFFAAILDEEEGHERQLREWVAAGRPSDG